MKKPMRNEAVDERVLAGVHRAGYSSYKWTQFLLMGWMVVALLMGWEEQLWAPLLIFGISSVWFLVQLVREGVMGEAGKLPKGQTPYSLKRILRLTLMVALYWASKSGLELWLKVRDGEALWDAGTPGLLMGNLALAVVWLASFLALFRFIAYWSNRVVERKIRKAEEKEEGSGSES